MTEIAAALAEAGAAFDDAFASIDARLAAIEARLADLEAPPDESFSPEPAPGAWQLVWSDEFAGSAPDPAKWTLGQNSWGGDTNGAEQQAWRAANSVVSGGLLRLVAKREPASGKQYSSGIVHTKSKAEWLCPMRLEIKATYPSGNGFWPGLWLLHDEYRKAGTYEIDVLEVMGHKPDETYHTYHFYPQDEVHKEIDCWKKQAPGFSKGAHVYLLEWLPESISWFIDGVLQQEIRSDSDEQIVTVLPGGQRTTAVGKPPIPNLPMHLIMDLSLGGWGGNAADETTPLPAELAIDYVRISRRTA